MKHEHGSSIACLCVCYSAEMSNLKTKNLQLRHSFYMVQRSKDIFRSQKIIA